ncbi:MAG: hypothetical protein UZ14_CFX002003157 [Chloroflexi bacterium OLB14]|nr:MAG: hypothetical protein UZ14_CFX002003157 [Chloroflexi bacterium OLB14]
MGKGFIVPNQKKKQEIQKSANRLSAIFVAITGVILAGTWVSTYLFINIGRWLTFSFFIAFMTGNLIWYRYSLTNLTKELVESSIRLSIFEKYSNLPFSSSFASLLFSEIAYLFFVYYGFKIMNEVINYAWYVRPVGIGVFAFGILGSIVSGYMIILRAKAHFSK